MSGPPRLVDSHVHLDRYPDKTVRTMLKRASGVGVGRLLTVATDLESSAAALVLAGRYSAVLAAAGVHPAGVAALPSATAALDALSRLVVDEMAAGGALAAIGEVGIDEHAADMPAQRRFFEGCLDLAAPSGLPVVLHVVGGSATHTTAMDLLRRRPAVRAVVHYFVGDARLAARYLDAGCLLSVGRPVTRPEHAALRAAIPTIPLDRLLLETDTYPLPGRTTEPRDVTTVCAVIASLTGRSYTDVAAQTTLNFETLVTRTRES
ncbi:MAG: TatD family hydrolase [Chloroflexi bacterium]|nr:TatD family hydrolase [Chloroflexota bacterium]